MYASAFLHVIAGGEDLRHGQHFLSVLLTHHKPRQMIIELQEGGVSFEDAWSVR